MDDSRVAGSPDEQIARYCSQYLQLEPKLDLPAREVLRESKTQATIFETLFDDGALRYAPPAHYQLRMLKDLVARIEASIDDWEEHEVSENLVSALAVRLSTPLPSELVSAQQQSYVSYHLSSLDAAPRPDAGDAPRSYVTMLENRSLIAAGGTTGLRTWEAALHLGEYLCENRHVVEGKRILELGAGTGYISILCAKHLGAAHGIASDGSDDVINNLPDNFFLNGLQDTGTVTAMDLKWGHALLGTEEEKWNGGRPVDVLLGADITYDHSIIPALVGTLEDVFALYPAVEVYISATQRNHATFQVFLDQCQGHGFAVEEISFPRPLNKARNQGPFYSDAVEIKICRISKSSS